MTESNPDRFVESEDTERLLYRADQRTLECFPTGSEVLVYTYVNASQREWRRAVVAEADKRTNRVVTELETARVTRKLNPDRDKFSASPTSPLLVRRGEFEILQQHPALIDAWVDSGYLDVSAREKSRLKGKLAQYSGCESAPMASSASERRKRDWSRGTIRAK
ncbi:MAG: hypothetical protein WD926_00010 [Patescibacteria group bacterium]